MSATKLQVETAYDYDASLHYDSRRFSSPQGQLFNRLETEQLNKALVLCPLTAEVLEIGCGSGRFTSVVASTGRKITALEPSDFMIDIAVQRCQNYPNVSFVKGEGRHLPVNSRAFDFVFAIRVLNQTQSVDYALATVEEMIRVAKPGGIVLVEFCNYYRPRFKTTKAVRLKLDEIIQVVLASYPRAQLDCAGILALSETVLQKTPGCLLRLYEAVDRDISTIASSVAARIYLTIKLPPFSVG